MNFNPTDATEDGGRVLLTPGEYLMTVREAEERISSKGNPMIVIELEADGHRGTVVRHYLVASPGSMYRVRDFCAAAGISATFQTGRLSEADIRGRRVRCKIAIEEGLDGYPDQNRVIEFMPDPNQVASSPDDDSIPF